MVLRSFVGGGGLSRRNLPRPGGMSTAAERPLAARRDGGAEVGPPRGRHEHARPLVLPGRLLAALEILAQGPQRRGREFPAGRPRLGLRDRLERPVPRQRLLGPQHRLGELALDLAGEGQLPPAPAVLPVQGRRPLQLGPPVLQLLPHGPCPRRPRSTAPIRRSSSEPSIAPRIVLRMLANRAASWVVI